MTNQNREEVSQGILRLNVKTGWSVIPDLAVEADAVGGK